MKQEKEKYNNEQPIDWYGAPDITVLLPNRPQDPELTHIPIVKAIFKLAWPAFTSMILLMIFNLVDIWWVGKLGAKALAGVSAASFLLWSLQSLATLVETGVNALVARYVGAKNPALASRVVGQGMILAVLLSVSFGFFGYFTQNIVYRYMGLEAEVLHFARQYMAYIFLGMITIFTTFTADAAFRGTGDTKTPLKIIAVALALNMILDPILIFGIGPFPRMEAGGAALATVISHGLAVLLCITILNKRQVKIKIFWSWKKFIDPALLWRIARIGAPIAFSGIMFSVSYMLLTRVISSFGPEPLAALGLGHRIEGLAYFGAVGFSVAAATLVGQNLGAKRIDRAEKSAWLALLFTVCILLVVSLVFFFFSKWIISFFINDPKVIAEGVRYLKIIAFFEIFLGSEIVLEGAFSGAGNSLPPMIVSVPLTWARIPLALFLAYTMGLGSAGVWWAIASTTCLKGVVMALWFKRGSWKHKQV